MRTPAFVILAAMALAAQQSPPAPSQAAASDPNDTVKFTGGTSQVLAPTTVLDRDGAVISGLKVSDFALYDNDKQQRIQADIVFQPISLVIAIQANQQVDKMLPKIQKIGAAIDQAILGETGEAAVIAFDHRVQVLQDFTTEKGKIDAAIKKISPYGSSSSRLNDAAMQAMNMLRNRRERRRILLLISETRDGSSAARPRDVLLQAQFSDVLVYTINISHWMAQLTRTAPVGRPDPIPPEAHHVPAAAGTMTPTMASQMDVGNTVPVFVEVFKAVKGIFIDNPSELLTKYTGGREYTFANQGSLDRAVLDIGDEIHSQYLLSYSPSNKEGGFHTIRVEVMGRPNLKIRTRPGYWIAGAADETDSKKPKR